MKALSVKQPWAELIARGEKTIEVRDWATKHRGPLLIVASKRPNVWATGCAIAVVDLVDCRPMASADEGAALGEHQQGAKAWVLENPRRVEPVPVTGRLGVYDVDLGSRPSRDPVITRPIAGCRRPVPPATCAPRPALRRWRSSP